MNKDELNEYKKMQSGISNLNPHRGGNSPNKAKGFYAEIINAAENNLDRINQGQKAREIVIDDNKSADSVIQYQNGQLGRRIQDKVGYTNSQLKKMLEDGRYDGMIFQINSDHPIFKKKKQLDELKEIAKKHNIKIVSSHATEKETVNLAKNALIESKIRNTIGLDDTKAPVSAMGYTVKKVATDTVDETKNFISTQTERFVSENFKELHQAGVDEAVNSAIFAAAFSTAKNTLAVIKGEESKTEALKEIAFDTSSAAVLGYATGVVKEKLNLAGTSDAALLVNGTIQISKQVLAYATGDIDERQLLTNVAETTAMLAASYVGKFIGSSLIPIPIVGEMVGEMITTAICGEIINTIKATKEFEKQNQKYISLYNRATYEIKASNERLKAIANEENEQLKQAIEQGLTDIFNSLSKDSYELFEKGIFTIGEKFGLSEEDFKKDLITKDNIFKTSEPFVLD